MTFSYLRNCANVQISNFYLPKYKTFSHSAECWNIFKFENFYLELDQIAAVFFEVLYFIKIEKV
jgi:hypothetical protein